MVNPVMLSRLRSRVNSGRRAAAPRPLFHFSPPAFGLYDPGGLCW